MGDYLIPDGASIVKACRWVRTKSRPKERIAGWDLFEFEMKAPLPPGGGLKEGKKKRVMFMGSSEKVLDAWSYGLSVITTPVGGIPDVAKDGENMLLFEPGDV